MTFSDESGQDRPIASFVGRLAYALPCGEEDPRTDPRLSPGHRGGDRKLGWGRTGRWANQAEADSGSTASRS